MASEFIKVKVEFYFSLTRANVHAEERLEMARKILTEGGGRIVSTDDKHKENIRQVVFLAEVPQSRFDMHHGFESRLNKSYPGGCGAGVVALE